jgi:hypothetical protein
VNSGRIKAFSHIASAYFSKIKGDFLNIMIISEADPEREEALVKKYILVYYGGATENDPKKAQETMGAWMKWFQDMGKAVVDGGAPTLPGKTVKGKTATKGVSGDPITGYSILQAEDLDSATAMAKKSPHLSAGGQIAIYELMPMAM